jgi:dTDP-4-dehydrorhamnose 3,5-epimerase-like enzyme
MPDKVVLLKGGGASDDRGSLHFVNDFTFDGVKRFYQIIHHDTGVVRAWQGHRVEHKYFYVTSGSFVVAWVPVDNWDNPSRDLVAEHCVLTGTAPAVLCIPPGYANGLKALEPGSVLTVYSNLDLQESEKDRWSFDKSLWIDWNKFSA